MKKILALLTATFALNSPLAQAKAFIKVMGNDAGGGGNAIVCRNSLGHISSAEMLDLFEARVLDQLNIKDPTPGADMRDRVIGYTEKLVTMNPENFKNISMFALSIMQKARMLPPDIGLEPIDDAFPILNKKGCKIEQLARYLDQRTGEGEQLLIDSEIWNALDANSQVALYLHESIYRYLRNVGATTSKRSRAIVGQLMAEMELTPVAATGKIAMRCADTAPEKSIEFTAVLDDESLIPVPSYNFYFSVINRQPLISESKMEIWARLLDDPNFQKEFDFTKSNFENNIYVELTRKEILSPTKVSFHVNFEGAPGENQGKGSVDNVVCEKTAL